MIESTLSHPQPTVRPPQADESAGFLLAGLTRDLFDLLNRLRARRAPGAPRRGARVYRDRDFEYVEVAVPGLGGVEADICIHGGRVYLRMPRETARPSA